MDRRYARTQDKQKTLQNKDKMSNWAYYGPDKADYSFLTDRLFPAKKIAVDIETVGKKDRTPIGLSMAINAWESFWFPIDSPVLPWGMLQSPDILKVYHNGLFDLDGLWEHKPDCTNIDDTLIRARLANYDRASLEYLAPTIGRSIPFTITDLLKKYKVKGCDQLPEEVIARKCCIDSQVTYQLSEELNLIESPDWYYKRELRLIPLLIKWSRRGMPVDTQRVEKEYNFCMKQLAYIQTLCEGLGFNPGSNQQVGYILSKRGAWLPMTQGRRQLKVDDDTLGPIDDFLAQTVLVYRHFQKLASTYYKPLLGKDWTRTWFSFETITNRISSRWPNLQNQPPSVRQVFYWPGEGVDFSQLELRNLAYFSKDKAMAEVFSSGGSIHKYTASKFFGPGYSDEQYKHAKAINFSAVYQTTPQGMAVKQGISVAQAQEFIEGFTHVYPEAWASILRQKADGIRTGYVTTLDGHKIKIPKYTPEGFPETEEGIGRKAVNYPIQGSAAEILRRALLYMEDLGNPINMQIHDEALMNRDLGEIRYDVDDLAHLSPIYTPVDVEQFKRWGE